MNDDTIFAAAIQHDTPGERSAFLEKACGTDKEQRSRVEALLAEYENPDSFFERPGIDNAETESVENIGTVIDRYKLLQQIGEGGFGVVYMAEQLKPVRRRVAIKIVKPGMDSTQVIARFEAERQALAMMDHQNIAKVLDAGTTQSGRPYFVMELVNGVHITDFCNDSRLSTRQRLELFIPVCNALQHAHQKGIIHRDVKPSNILIGLYDGEPVPKVIDFGVAKAIEQRLTDKTVFTRFGQLIGTLDYMSPEQAELNQLDVDTRADVYSLGAVLYELLTGETTYDRERLSAAAFDEIMRIIREVDPLRPSVRLQSSFNLKAISVQRNTEPEKLSRTMDGELDWIIMKALNKQRARRYATANDMARDIQRYLVDLPVEAGPPSRVYRLRKFVRKHKRGLSVAAAFAFLLILASILSSVLAIRWRIAAMDAIAQARRADANANDAVRNLYTAHMQQIQLEWDKSNLGRVRELLIRHASGEPDYEDPRGWEWHYWSQMCRLELRTFQHHQHDVNAVVFNHDGSRVVSAGGDGQLYIWSLPDGQLIQRIDAHDGPITCVAFHKNVIASGGVDRRFRLWTVDGSRELASFNYDNTIACMTFSQDGKRLAVGARSTTGVATPKNLIERRILDVPTLQETHRLDAPRDVRAVAFTHDGSQVVFTASPNLEFWNADTGELVRRVEVDRLQENNAQYRRTTGLALSKTGQFFVTSSEDRVVRIHRFSDAQSTMDLSGHTSAVIDVALSPDEQTIASAGADNTIILWNVETGEQIRKLRGHEQSVLSVSYSPDGLRLASASKDQTVKIWDAVLRTDFRPFLTRAQGHHWTSRFSPDSRLYAVSNFAGPEIGNEFYQWVDVRDALTGRRAYQVTGHSGWIDSIAISPDGSKIATGAKDQTVRIFDTATQKELRTLDGFASSIWELDFGPHGNLLKIKTTDRDSQTHVPRHSYEIWDVETGERKRAFTATSLVFHPNGRIIALSSTDETKTSVDFHRVDVSPANQQPFRSWTLVSEARRLAYAPSGHRLAANVGDELVVWDSDGVVVTTIEDSGSFLGFDQFGERVFTRSGEQTLAVWHSETGDSMCEIPLPDQVMGVEISPDGARVSARNIAYVQNLEIGSLDEPTQVHLEARNLAAYLLKFPLLDEHFLTKTKAEILHEVSQTKTVSAEVRRVTAALIEDIYTHEEEAAQFGYAGFFIVYEPNRTETDYRKAFKWISKAYEMTPDQHGMQYGFALYRLGRFQEALDAMERSFEKQAQLDARFVPGYLSSIAMAQFQVGLKEEAAESLARAKSHPEALHYGNGEVFREASALIAPHE